MVICVSPMVIYTSVGRIRRLMCDHLRQSVVTEGQMAVTTLYDAEGRVTSINEGAGGVGPYVSTFGYNTNDQLQTVTLPGGVQESTGYDANSQPVGVTAVGPQTGATGATFTRLNSQYGYPYDAAGRVSSVTTLSDTDSLSYDGASRLVNEVAQPGSTQVIAKGGVYHWTYDANGAILTAVDDSGYTGGITYTDIYTYSTTLLDEIVQMGTTGTLVTKTTAYGYDTHDATRIANTAAGERPERYRARLESRRVGTCDAGRAREKSSGERGRSRRCPPVPDGTRGRARGPRSPALVFPPLVLTFHEP